MFKNMLFLKTYQASGQMKQTTKNISILFRFSIPFILQPLQVKLAGKNNVT